MDAIAPRVAANPWIGRPRGSTPARVLRNWRKELRAWRKRRRRRLGGLRFGSFRNVRPLRPTFGVGWGKCIDRYYIESFLAEHADDVHGRVLEVLDDSYTRRFGGPRVTRSDVLHKVPGNPQATIVGDLANEQDFPGEEFDCLIITQTLQYVFDLHAAVRTMYRMLSPGGVVLATVPGISQISVYDRGQWGEHWRFTTSSARQLFAAMFGSENVEVQAYGNVLAAVGLLEGVVVEELTPEELDYRDPAYEVSIAIRAVKPQG